MLSTHSLQARIVALNAQYFLKTGGNFVISIKASCIDSTAQPEAVFAREIKKLIESQLKPKEQVRLVHWHAAAADSEDGTSRQHAAYLLCKNRCYTMSAPANLGTPTKQFHPCVQRTFTGRSVVCLHDAHVW